MACSEIAECYRKYRGDRHSFINLIAVNNVTDSTAEAK
jgi:hypothetical protein